MVRTQVQFTESQFESLKRLASMKGCSVAKLVRQGVEILLQGQAVSPCELRMRAASVSGRFRSGLSDLSREHDRYFAESARR